ncbi:hypothetical protein ABZ912_46835 [Nonomuraea angiospora]|uniref:hypothetical protein n=1 Tax=Nonomuraea angiospora TaxID=46172 RepID=UPI00340D988D
MLTLTKHIGSRRPHAESRQPRPRPPWARDGNHSARSQVADPSKEVLAAGRHTVDFVGSQFNGPGSLGDHDHEGHPGWRIDQIDANITGWLRTYTPRTVLLHIGTNDVLQNYNLVGAPQRLSTLIDHITTAVPDEDVFVATIT